MNRKNFVLSIVLFCTLQFTCAQQYEQEQKSATRLISEIYHDCLQYYSISCVKPKTLKWISNVYDKDVIQITDDLQIRKTGELSPDDQQERRNANTNPEIEILDKVDDFLATHELHIKVPEALRQGGALGQFVPRNLAPEDVSVPLTSEARHRKKKSGLMRKVIIPFLLGLKFKAGVIVPLALALIAAKTWKALTLGLLSLVLSGALVIFKFTKPKIVNYEVIHYPHHVDHHVDHIEHAPPPGWEHPGYGRTFDAQDLAYRGLRD